MYQFKDKIPNIKELSKIFSKVAYVKNGIFVLGNTNFEINPMLYTSDITNNNIWIKDENWGNFLINFSNREIKKLDFNIGLNGKIENIIIIAENGIASCFSVSQQKIICNIDIKGIIRYYLTYNDNLFCHIDSNKLVSLSLLTGDYGWEIDLSEKLGNYDKIAKIYGIVNEVLWLVSQRGIIYGIDIHTGQLQHHLNYDNVDYFQERGSVGTVYFYSLFDEKNQKLIGLYAKRYWEIDLLSPENGLQVFDIKDNNSDYFSDEWADPKGMIFDEDYIYFRDISISKVGVFGRKTRHIVWSGKVNDSEERVMTVINNIQVADNKLYVLDSGGTLHIFEKVKN